MKTTFFLITILAWSQIVHAQWVSVGSEDGISEVSASYAIVKVNPFDNQPYAAYISLHPELGTYHVSVMTYNGSTWDFVGDEYITLPFSDEFVSHPPQSLLLEMSPIENLPMVSVNRHDNDPEGALDGNFLLQYTGSAWEAVSPYPSGLAFLFSIFDNKCDLAISPVDGSATICFESIIEPGVTVVKYTGEEWITLGTPPVTPQTSTYQAIAYDPISLEPYLFHGGSTNYGLGVLRYSGDSWIQVGQEDIFQGTTATSQRDDCIVIHPITGVPYIAYVTNESGPGGLAIRKLVDDTWELVGPSDQNPIQCPLPEGRVFDMDINPVTGEPYVLLNTNLAPTLYRFDGENWIAVGDDPIVFGQRTGMSIAFDFESGAPYVSFHGGGSYTQVMRWEGAISSVDEEINNEGIRLYPNPAVKLFTVLSPAPGKQVSYSLIDSNGNWVLELENTRLRTEISVEDLNSGTYLLRATGDGFNVTGKVIVN